MDYFWAPLAVLFSVLLLVYLATKTSGRTIGIVLGAGILLIFVWGNSRVSFEAFRARQRAAESVDAATALRADIAIGNSTEEPTISNKELWDRLTKSHIDLSEETPGSEAKNKSEDQATEKDQAESTPIKPDWVENPPKRVGNLFRRVVSSEPYSTTEECHQHLEKQLQEAVRERVRTLIAESGEPSILTPDFDSFGIGLSYIMREICQDEFTETVSASFGEMKRVHVLMVFSPAVEDHLRAQWKEYGRRHRLGVVGIFAAAALSLLAGVYGLLQFDTWTRGYYTKRLLVGVPVVIIVAVVLLLS